VGEVAEVSPRAGAERADGGGVLSERGLCAPHFFAWKKRLREAGVGPEVARTSLGSLWKCKWFRPEWGQGEIRGSRAAASVSRSAGDARVEVLLKKGGACWWGRASTPKLVRALVAVVESAA